MDERNAVGIYLVRLGLFFVAQSRIGEALPVGSSAPTGPLGAAPGGPQGPVPIGTGGSSNGTTSSSFPTSTRSVDTILAALCALLMTVTYAVLIGPGTRLASTSKVPLASIETNIGNLLSRSWPDTSASSNVGSKSTTPQDQDAIRLMYVGKMRDTEKRAARGVDQCNASPGRRINRPPMWLTTGSSLTRSMVQLAVWEWVSIWLVLIMVTSTILFNGFFTNNRNSDSYPRLVVVLIYLISFCVHAWYVWKVCRSFFTLLGAGASWSLLNKASFASVDLGQLNMGISGGKQPVFKQVGKPAASATFPAIEDCSLKDSRPINTTQSAASNPTSPDEDMGTADTVNDWQKREITTTVDAGKTALERILANVMAIVGITITTGFASWTSMASSADSTTQLGSLALLASLTLGTGAMFSSAIDLSVMNTSFKNILFLKEVMINGQAAAHVQKRAKRKSVIGFTHDTVPTRAVHMIDCLRSTSIWCLLLFGPGYALLPSEEDHSRQSAGAEFEFSVAVRGRSVLLTTVTTDQHQKHADGNNVEAINVCHVSQPKVDSDSSAGLDKGEPRVESQ